MKIYISRDNKLIEVSHLEQTASSKSTWIDIISPTEQERNDIGSYFSIKIPTKEEIQEIESSSRLYKEADALFMTINAIKRQGNGELNIVHVTFILKENALLTVRYDDVISFEKFLKLAITKSNFLIDNPLSLLLGMLENIVYAMADTLENINSTVELLSKKILTKNVGIKHDLSTVLISMGVEGEINAKIRHSLSNINMMVGYLKFNLSKENEKLFESRLEPLKLDASDLKDYSAFLEQKISFTLDTCLGLIHIEQNNIIKIFSIAAVALLPPTLIASIYGMNFKYMPGLDSAVGYPIALVLIILSSALPYLFFKKKGWL